MDSLKENLLVIGIALVVVLFLLSPFVDPLLRILRIRGYKRELQGKRSLLSVRAVLVILAAIALSMFFIWPAHNYGPPKGSLATLSPQELADYRRHYRDAEHNSSANATDRARSEQVLKSLPIPVLVDLSVDHRESRTKLPGGFTVPEFLVALLVLAVIFVNIGKPLVEALRRRESELEQEVRVARTRRR